MIDLMVNRLLLGTTDLGLKIEGKEVSHKRYNGEPLIIRNNRPMVKVDILLGSHSPINSLSNSFLD